jgi:hypothetical protein
VKKVEYAIAECMSGRVSMEEMLNIHWEDLEKKSGALILSQKMSAPDVARSCNFVKLIRIGTIIPFHGDQTA